MKIHRYSFPFPLLSWLFNIIAWMMIVGSVLATLKIFLSGKIVFNADYLVVFLFGAYVLYVSNFWPEIASDEEGLLVRFSFWRLRVRWEDVIEVKPRFGTILWKRFMGSLAGPDGYVVKTRTLTPFHRLYGLIVLSFSSSFFLQSDINDFQELLKEIQNKTSTHSSEKLTV